GGSPVGYAPEASQFSPERECDELESEGVVASSLSAFPQLPVRIRMLSPRRSFRASFHWALSASVAQPTPKIRTKLNAPKRFMRFPVTIELADFPRRLYSRTGREMQQRFRSKIKQLNSRHLSSAPGHPLTGEYQM